VDRWNAPESENWKCRIWTESTFETPEAADKKSQTTFAKSQNAANWIFGNRFSTVLEVSISGITPLLLIKVLTQSHNQWGH
jgi:hypothetical protein